MILSQTIVCSYPVFLFIYQHLAFLARNLSTPHLLKERLLLFYWEVKVNPGHSSCYHDNKRQVRTCWSFCKNWKTQIHLCLKIILHKQTWKSYLRNSCTSISTEVRYEVVNCEFLYKHLCTYLHHWLCLLVWQWGR